MGLVSLVSSDSRPDIISIHVDRFTKGTRLVEIVEGETGATFVRWKHLLDSVISRDVRTPLSLDISSVISDNALPGPLLDGNRHANFYWVQNPSPGCFTNLNSRTNVGHKVFVLVRLVHSPQSLKTEAPFLSVQATQSMNKIRVVIADDEPLARRRMRELITKHQDFVVIGEARNGTETVRILLELKPDIVFLNVQMPEFDGFEVLREIGAENMPIVIFVSAHDEFAVRAFETPALDYLVKPLEETRFAQALERVRKWLMSEKAVDLSRQLTAILAARKQEQPTQRVFVPRRSGDDLVLDPEEIHWIEADNYYAAIHARGGRHLVRESLASLEQRLDHTRFVRVHRCAIVNIDCVRKVRKKARGLILVLTDGANVSVSRRRSPQVLRLLRPRKR